MSRSEELYEANKETFASLLALYKDYNSHTNISAIRDDETIIEKHFLDSLEILNHLDLADNSRVLDLGSGGGFPVLPLAIVLPELKFVALDARAKKTHFIELVKEKLSLNNLEILTGRAEDFAHQEAHRENYDFVLARAVAQLNILLELVSAFLKPGAKFFAYKAYPIDEEERSSVNAQKELALNFIDRKLIDDNRQILIFNKEANLDSQYPREFSKIKNKTL